MTESDSEIDLSLSCGSSSFEEEEDGEQDADLNTTEESAGIVSGGINPYQFEPYAPDADNAGSDRSESSDEDENNDRLNNTTWCDLIHLLYLLIKRFHQRTFLFLSVI